MRQDDPMMNRPAAGPHRRLGLPHALRRAAWRWVLAVICLSMISAMLGGVASAQDRTPLLLDGKTTLYQRVLTRPEAVVRASPDENADIVVAPVPPFTVYYVYEAEQTGDGSIWLEVGASSNGTTTGWVQRDHTVRWDTNMTVAFANPANRDPVLFFDDRESLAEIATGPEPGAQLDALRTLVENGSFGPDFPVISTEPDTYVDLREQFYLLPIITAEEVYMESGFTTRLLQIASVTLPKDVPEETAPPPPDRDALLEDFKAGIVFVIDTTTSMGPYIDRTRETVRSIYQQMEAAGLLGRVAFGLVGYRDNTDAVPGLNYVARVFADLEEGADPVAFFDNVASVSPANVSSEGFVEDAYAGLVTAIDDMQWDEFGGRYVVLITDAGARRGSDSLSSTGLDAEQVRQLARDREIAIYTLHLLTDVGAEDHEDAAAQYTVLSTFPGLAQALYYPVAAGNLAQFTAVVETLSQALAGQVTDAAAAFGPGDQPPDQPLDQPPPVRNSEDPIFRITDDTQVVGQAMLLAYLGREQQTEAPSVFRAWAADRDFDNPSVTALNVRVLLSKNQLSDLQEVLKSVVEAARVGQITPSTFFEELRSAALALSRDPTLVGSEEARNLADLGLIGEYLEGLPYESKIMSIDQDLWLSWSVGEQQAFIDEIEAKIRLYEAYHNDVDRWIELDGGVVPGDAVYPIPLDALP